MYKYLIAFFFSFFVNEIYSQKYNGYVITVNNDTIKTKIEFTRGAFDVNRLRFLQDKVVTYKDNQKRIYLPYELLSFQIELDYQLITFDNIDDTTFGQRLYSNNVRLNKLVYVTGGTIFTYYMIKRPNSDIVNRFQALGLRNLVSKKTMLKEMWDCKISYDIIKNNEMRIKDEQALIDFVIDFEKNCYSH